MMDDAVEVRNPGKILMIVIAIIALSTIYVFWEVSASEKVEQPRPVAFRIGAYIIIGMATCITYGLGGIGLIRDVACGRQDSSTLGVGAIFVLGLFFLHMLLSVLADKQHWFDALPFS